MNCLLPSTKSKNLEISKFIDTVKSFFIHFFVILGHEHESEPNEKNEFSSWPIQPKRLKMNSLLFKIYLYH